MNVQYSGGRAILLLDEVRRLGTVLPPHRVALYVALWGGVLLRLTRLVGVLARLLATAGADEEERARPQNAPSNGSHSEARQEAVAILPRLGRRGRRAQLQRAARHTALRLP
jgi:hypothetical protein